MTSTLIATIIILGLCAIGFGIGVLFFGKEPKSTECGNIREIDEPCASQDAGICPVTDKTGAVKMMHQTKLTATRHSKKKPPTP